MSTVKTEEKKEGQSPKKKNKIFPIILVFLIAGGSWFGISKYVHGQHHEETDDAQVESNISPVVPKVQGYIARLYVHDNQFVNKGDTLLVLDDREFKVALHQAEAALLTAKSGLSAAQANATAVNTNKNTAAAAVKTVEAQIEQA